MKKYLISLVLVALVVVATPSFAASNPFADVPAGHWSYDAVAYLASRGVVCGFPDGQYRGGQLATRYEMASIVARALVKIDLDKASQEDLKPVNNLVKEFTPELEALGVQIRDNSKLNALEKRVNSLEKNIGGLRLNGFIWFDTKWEGSDNQASTTPSFYFQRARFFVNYQVDKNTSFLARVNFKGMDGKSSSDSFKVDRLFFNTKLPWGIKARIGYQTQDWDGEYHLYDVHVGGFGDGDAYWSKRKFLGFTFTKDWGLFDLQAIVGRNHFTLDSYDGNYGNQSYMSYGAKLGYKGEKLKLGLFYTGEKLDGNEDKVVLRQSKDPCTDAKNGWEIKAKDLGNVQNYGAYFRYSVPFGEFFGTYNQQQANTYTITGQGGDKIDGNAKFWLAGVEIWNNYLAGFSFRAEYMRRDAGFIYNDGVCENYSPMDDPLFNFGAYGHTRYSHEMMRATIDYHFSKKFDMFARYIRVSALNNFGPDTTEQWDFGGRYKYTKNIHFLAQVAFSDYGNGIPDDTKRTRGVNYKGKEVIFRFRTQFTF